jgi:hypothetical protein
MLHESIAHLAAVEFAAGPARRNSDGGKAAFAARKGGLRSVRPSA